MYLRALCIKFNHLRDDKPWFSVVGMAFNKKIIRQSFYGKQLIYIKLIQDTRRASMLSIMQGNDSAKIISRSVLGTRLDKW